MATVKKEGNTIYIQHMDKMRKVGVIVGGLMAEKSDGDEKDSVVLLIERDRSKHLMEVWQAYGFSKEVIDHKDWFDYVQLIETTPSRSNIYIIPRKELIIHGREYETDNFERQYFVPISKLQQYKIN